jgi:nicotinamide mononucleotide transporter
VEKSIEIFTLITGVIYVILEIKQKNSMWLLGIFTSLAAMWMFFVKGAYASFGLNTYYLITSFVGLWQWKRDETAVAESGLEDDAIRIRHLSLKVILISLAMIIAGTAALSWGMDRLYVLGLLNENPLSLLDSLATTMSVVATWWLVRSYLQQWWLWILADTLSAVLCALYGMWWMTLLYVAYAAAAVIGLRHWTKHGVKI